MKCQISNCNHHIRRGLNSNARLSDSWKLYGICVCCAIELKKAGVIDNDFPHSNICIQSLRLEKLLNQKNRKNDLEAIPRNRPPYNLITIYS